METVKDVLKGRNPSHSIVVFIKGEQYGWIMSVADGIENFGDMKVKKYWIETQLCIMLK